MTPEFSFAFTTGLLDRKHFSLSQTNSSADFNSVCSYFVDSSLTGQDAEIRLMLTSFNTSSIEQSILFNLSMLDVFDPSRKKLIVLANFALLTCHFGLFSAIPVHLYV